ncbi:hypothetical protein KR093_001528 [Drosophila rubida]|uniref:palmitoyl-protein hydrolase n=1 Tax=Drosophila rubida TaxID=30044 RepID=A0AAD4K655_9MUSC|nr:hypothetical protein KR093_001528 [Drosophila rubida]
MKRTASVIFFHGSGDTGAGIKDWVRSVLGRDFRGAHIRYVYPTAPWQRYTPFGGDKSNVWFDRQKVHIAADEESESMSEAYSIAKGLIREQLDDGIPLHRIIVGGFSMGGALALHTGYHLNTSVGGVFAHSAFLNRESIVYDSLANETDPPELCMLHGTNDQMVEFDWGRETYDALSELGVNGSFTVLPDVEHELTESSMRDVEQWILEKLP